MKVLLLSTIIGLATQLSFAYTDSAASHGCADCDKKLRGMPGEKLGDIEKLAKARIAEDERLLVLGETICGIYSGDGTKIAAKVKYQIVNYIKRYEKQYNPSSVADIVKFLNRNKNKILCENGTKSYLMMAFDYSAHAQVYDKLIFGDLFLDDGPYVDLNAVSVINGKPQTVLDYIDEQLADPRRSDDFKREVRALKEMFVEEPLYAKNYNNLPLADRIKYNKLMLEE